MGRKVFQRRPPLSKSLKSNMKSLKSSKTPRLRRSKDMLHHTPHMPEYNTSPQLPELSPHTSTTHMVILFTSVKLIPPTFTPTHMLVLPTPTHTTTRTTMHTTQLY